MKSILFIVILSFCGAVFSQTYPPQISSVNPSGLITITDQQSANVLRDDLKTKIFGGVALDISLQPVYYNTFNTSGTTWAGSTNMASVEEWRVTVAKGMISRLYRFKPAIYRNPTSGKAGFIIAAGHGQIGTFPPFTDLIKWLVASGYEVFTVDMPLSGLNVPPMTVSGPNGGTVNLTSHDSMVALQTPSFNPLRIFLEPVLAIVNNFESRGISNIGMAGLSGGGWTTDVYSALDPRIDASYSVAGSMPIYARSWAPPHSSLGDWEQQSIAGLGVDYLDLYVLASVGQGRYHANIHIVNDDCCFGGYVANHYAPSVAAVVSSIGVGGYGVAFDTSVNVHTVSPWTQNFIQSDVRGRF